MNMRIIAIITLLFFASCRQVSLEQAIDICEKTADRYQQQLNKQPANQALRFQLASFYYRLGNFTAVRKFIYANDNRAAKALLAKTYANLREYDQAFALFIQLGEEGDDEYLFLYGQVLEKKNAYPQAVKIYQRVKGRYQEQARRRAEQIGLTFQKSIPLEIKSVLEQERDFLKTLTEDPAVTIFAHEQIEIKPDNTSISQVHAAIKILNEKGKNFGEVQIGYDSSDQRVELEYARAITPDGTVVYAGKENIRDVSKYLNFPLYSNAKIFIISMPAVSIGTIIEYKLNIHSSKLINTKDFSYIYRLREGIPLVRGDFSINIPKDRIAKIKTLNAQFAGDASLEPVITRTENQTRYRWNFKHIQPIIPEDGMEQIALVNPGIMISSFLSWDEIYQWWTALYQDKLSLNDEMKKVLTDLTKKCTADEEKAKKIYQFCSRDIRYVAVEYGESGYEPHQARDIFWNRYGDCKDKTILTVALLRAAGLEAYPVLVATRQEYAVQDDFPALLFNHAVAAVRLNGKLMFLDPTASTVSLGDLPLDDQERRALIFGERNYFLETIPQITANGIDYRTEIEINNDLSAKISRITSGRGYYAAAQRYYFQYTHPKKLKEDIGQFITRLYPSNVLFDVTAENADSFDLLPILRYNFNAKNFLNDKQIEPNIPLLTDINFDPAYIGKSERVYGLEFEGVHADTSRISISLPKSYKVHYLPSNLTVETPWFTFKSEYSCIKNKIFRECALTILKRFVTVQEYPEFKKQAEKILHAFEERIMVTTRKKK